MELSHGQDGRGPKPTFSIADTTDSLVAVSGDLMGYSESGIVNRSTKPILSRHFTGLIRIIYYIIRIIYYKDYSVSCMMYVSSVDSRSVYNTIVASKIIGHCNINTGINTILK